MKTLKWILGILQVLAVGAIGKLLYDNFYSILLYFLAYPTKVLLSVVVLILIILAICAIEINLTRKINLRNSFEVSKPVKKLTFNDFHITNYNEFYIERESDKEIESLLRERKYVFITGIPMLGKTRMAYEATKKLKDFYLLKPKYERIDVHKLKLPLFKKRIVLFLDDLDKYEGKNLDELIRKLKEKTKDFVVIVTCRSGKEFDQVFAKKEMETLLTECQKVKTEPRKLEREEESKLAMAVRKSLVNIASDGTPGSITIDLRYMKGRYQNLGDEKSVLKCLKLLRAGNTFLWKETLVKKISNRIFDLNIQRTKWDSYINSLSDNGFIMESSGSILISHDIYLDDRFLDEYLVEDDELIKLKESLFDYKDAENLFHLGNAFYFKKNPAEALECYEKSSKINPDSAVTYYNSGVLLGEIKEYRAAEKEYRKALRINPDDVKAHFNLGNLLKKLERHKEAETEYRAAVRLNPKDGAAHSNLGNSLHALKRYQEAENEFREALRINPKLAEARNNLGAVFYELKRYDEAGKEYREVLRINPEYAPAHNNLGNLFADLKKYDEAEKEYKEALRINSDFGEAHNNLGILLVELERYKEAEKEYRKALRINPDFAEAHSNLGSLLPELKRYEEAEKEHREAMCIKPDLAEAHINLGILLIDLDRKDEAKKEFVIARDLFRKQGREEDAKKAEGFLKDL